jgi:hypothetical protein
VIDPTASDRSTDQIITLLGNVNISDEVAQHGYGGSIDQAGGNTQYSGLDVQVTSPNPDTQPVIIQNDGIITDYWTNAYMPDSIAGNVRLLIKTREDGINIDGKRVTGRLLEYGDLYFTGSTTLGQATTSLALFSSPDGNNGTAAGTVAGAPYNTIVITEGYQTLDYGDGSGATPFGTSIAFGSATSLQTYERTKYNQRRGTVETIYGRNYQLVVGMNMNFDWDGGTAAWTEDEIVAWGTQIPYTTGAGTLVAVDEVVEGVTSGARGRVIYVDDTAGTGTIIVADVEGTFQNSENLTTVRGASEWTATAGTIVSNAAAGRMLLIASTGTTTGSHYGQRLSGIIPADNQSIFGATSGETALVNEPTTGVLTRTINNQFVGNYTGTNFQTNFGIAIAVANAIAGDAFPNLDGTTINPPDNRSGTVTNLQIGDYVTVFPWDGVATDINGDAEPDFNEMTLTTALTGGVSTSVVVGASNIPANTPNAGFLRVQRDSDSNLDLLEYSSFTNTTGTFTLVGTAPSNAAISNTVMRAFIDQQVSAGSSLAYSAQYTNPGQEVAITVRRGGSPNPIKTFKTTATFGPFSISAIRTPDD